MSDPLPAAEAGCETC